MKIGTGQTVYEEILSLDIDNNPVTGVTFDALIYRDGASDGDINIDISLTDPVRGVYSASWSASTVGNHQLYVKNNDTSVIFVSQNILVIPDSELTTDIYIGL